MSDCCDGCAALERFARDLDCVRGAVGNIEEAALLRQLFHGFANRIDWATLDRIVDTALRMVRRLDRHPGARRRLEAYLAESGYRHNAVRSRSSGSRRACECATGTLRESSKR